MYGSKLFLLKIKEGTSRSQESDSRMVQKLMRDVLSMELKSQNLNPVCTFDSKKYQLCTLYYVDDTLIIRSMKSLLEM